MPVCEKPRPLWAGVDKISANSRAPFVIAGFGRDDRKNLDKMHPAINLAGLLLNSQVDNTMRLLQNRPSEFPFPREGGKGRRLRGMIGKGLRSGVHGCLGFFSREGVKNLPAMQGKGLRGHSHCEYPKIRKALSFPLISPVARPGCFSQRAHPQPVLLHPHRGRPIPLINHTPAGKSSTVRSEKTRSTSVISSAYTQ